MSEDFMNGADEDVRTLLQTGSSDLPPGIDLLRGVREQQAPARRRARYRTRALVSAGAVALVAGATVLATTLTATVASAPPALAAVTAAAAKTSAESFHVTIKAVTVEPVPPGRGSTLVLPWGITGEYDPSRGIGEETVTAPHTPSAQVIYVGQQMYVHLDVPPVKNPPASGPGPNPRPWTELPIWPPLSATAIAVSPDFGQQQSTDPGALLGLLKSVGTVTDQGPASGPHWTGTKYGFSVTAPKDTAGASGTIDVDSKGQVRRMLVTLTFAAGGGVNFTCTEDVTYSDFGQPVSVTVPPASQVNRAGSGSHGMIGLVPW
jgi:hypothetical protein